MHFFPSLYRLGKEWAIPISLIASIIFGWQACAVSGGGKPQVDRHERGLAIQITGDPNPYGSKTAGMTLAPLTALDATSLQWTLAQEVKGLELFEHVTRYDEPLSFMVKPAYELSVYGAWLGRDEENVLLAEESIDAPIPGWLAQTSTRGIATRRGLMARYELKDLRSGEVLEKWHSFSEASFSATLPEIVQPFLEEEHRQILARIVGTEAEQTSEQVLVETAERAAEQTPEQALVETAERAAGQIPEQGLVEKAERAAGQIPEQALVETAERAAEQIPEQALVEKTERAAEQIPEQALVEKTERAAEQIPEQAFVDGGRLGPHRTDNLAVVQAPPEFGLFIEGRSTHHKERQLARFASQTDPHDSPFYAYFGTVDTAYVRAQLADFHHQLALALSRRISASTMRHFPWDGNYKLIFVVMALDFEHEGEMQTDWRQGTSTAQISVQLIHLPDKKVLFSQSAPLIIRVKKYTYEGKQTLASLSNAAAQQIVQILEGYLAQEHSGMQ